MKFHLTAFVAGLVLAMGTSVASADEEGPTVPEGWRHFTAAARPPCTSVPTGRISSCPTAATVSRRTLTVLRAK